MSGTALGGVKNKYSRGNGLRSRPTYRWHQKGLSSRHDEEYKTPSNSQAVPSIQMKYGEYLFCNLKKDCEETQRML